MVELGERLCTKEIYSAVRQHLQQLKLSDFKDRSGKTHKTEWLETTMLETIQAWTSGRHLNLLFNPDISWGLVCNSGSLPQKDGRGGRLEFEFRGWELDESRAEFRKRSLNEFGRLIKEHLEAVDSSEHVEEDLSRNLKIFLMYQMGGKSENQIAKKTKRSKAQVSAILTSASSQLSIALRPENKSGRPEI